SSRRRHTRFDCDWSSDVCSSDLNPEAACPAGASRSCGLESAPKCGFCSSEVWSEIVRQRAGNNGDWVKVGAFIRVARARANRYLNVARVRREKPIPEALPAGRFLRPNRPFPAWSLIRNGLLRT